jgi:hypothetical protein
MSQINEMSVTERNTLIRETFIQMKKEGYQVHVIHARLAERFKLSPEYIKLIRFTKPELSNKY